MLISLVIVMTLHAWLILLVVLGAIMHVLLLLLWFCFSFQPSTNHLFSSFPLFLFYPLYFTPFILGPVCVCMCVCACACVLACCHAAERSRCLRAWLTRPRCPRRGARQHSPGRGSYSALPLSSLHLTFLFYFLHHLYSVGFLTNRFIWNTIDNLLR